MVQILVVRTFTLAYCFLFTFVPSSASFSLWLPPPGYTELRN
jgi:hypothetical protein